MPENDKDLRLAVLIDADNASRTAMKDVMAEVAVYGTPTIKRIYGDWTAPNMNSWKSILLECAITPVQQYSYTTGRDRALRYHRRHGHSLFRHLRRLCAG